MGVGECGKNFDKCGKQVWRREHSVKTSISVETTETGPFCCAGPQWCEINGGTTSGPGEGKGGRKRGGRLAKKGGPDVAINSVREEHEVC